ncbi:vesicle coat protein [Truncatella angustata]|uniref:Vesicle coat protein n=1 Tax=Truncatella angustata TaxID=152316 RepID=A0A9P8ZYH2_9PEZI|nr:vesicle coat protein [Truncatella angustata]KAH6654035.1 vesicle coat protein [Truncatella angustata]
MASILCLAHYCDLHGPTPLMVTEGLPVPCSRCYDETIDAGRAHTATSSGVPPAVADAMRKMTLDSSRTTGSPQEVQRAATNRASKPQLEKPAAAPAMETPPQSPRDAPEGFKDQSKKSFRKTYDDYVTKNANPCQNCALTLPKRQDSKKGNENLTSAGDKSDLQGPTLRTRAPYARVYGGGSRDASPPNSNPQSSCTSDDEDVAPTSVARGSSSRRPTTATSHSSISSKPSANTHTHYLDYTSTHESHVANTYSLVRNSCLRTLSFETLPRRADHGANSAMNSPISGVPPPLGPSYTSPPLSVNPAYINATPTPQSAASGGPIFFGDSINGFTTAYIFRIPDMHARGRKRVYAFLALTTHRERVAMKVFGFISAAFRDLAAWVQDLADAEAERERERLELQGGITSNLSSYGGGYERGPRDSGVGFGLGGGSFPDQDRERSRDSGSSFLTGGGRTGLTNRMGMGGSMGPGGFAPKSRGLAELVGLPDFFIELHSRFVRLLLELGVVLGS